MYREGPQSGLDSNEAITEPGHAGAAGGKPYYAMACSSGDGGARDGRGSSDTPRGVPPPPGAIPVVTAADGGPSGATRLGLPVPPPPGGASPVCEAGSGDSGGPPPAPDADTGSSRDLILPIGVQIGGRPTIVPYLRGANPEKGRTEDERSTYGGVWVPFSMHKNVLTVSELAAQEGGGVRFSVVLAASNRLIRELGPDRARVVFEQKGTADEMVRFDFIMQHEILRACVLQAIADTIGIENMRGITLSMREMRDDGKYRDIVLNEVAQFMDKLNRNEAVDSFFGAPTTVPHAASKALPGSKKGGDVDVNDEYRYLAADIGLVRATIARHNLCRWLSYRGSDRSTTEAGDRTTTECLRELAVRALGISEDRWPAPMEELDGMGFYRGDKGGVVRMAPYYVEHAQIIVDGSDDNDLMDDVMIAEEEDSEPKKKSHPVPMVVPGGPWPRGWLQRHGVDTSTTGFSKQASTVLRAIVNPVLAAYLRSITTAEGNLDDLREKMFPGGGQDADHTFGNLLAWANSRERDAGAGGTREGRKKKSPLYPHNIYPRDVNDAVRAYVLSVVELALRYEKEGRFRGA